MIVRVLYIDNNHNIIQHVYQCDGGVFLKFY